jgi:hypothetical protein
MSLAQPTGGSVEPADAEYRPFPFRRVHSIAQLLLCVLLLWPYRGWIGWNLFGVIIHSDVPQRRTVINGDIELPMQPDRAFDQWRRRQDNAMDMVASLNLPGGVMQIIFSEDHRVWDPGHVDFKVWNAISFPVFALPFWWMAGRGAEALSAARRKLLLPRIGWTATIISFLFIVGGAALAIGFLFSEGPDRADPQLQLLAAGAAMWSVLGSLTVVARLAQWRIKKNALAPVPDASAVPSSS